MQKSFRLSGLKSWLNRSRRVFVFATILIIAATVGVVFAVRAKRNASFAVDLPSASNMVEVHFLNTSSSNSSITTTGYNGNESIIMKTYDNKYVLLDTANRNSEILQVIYDGLHEMQGTTKVTIDYLIISHFHGDHVGNAVKALLHNYRFKK